MKPPQLQEATKRQVPGAACEFALTDVQLADGPAGEGGPGRFEMTAYTGEPILGHWYWGNLGIDLSGIQHKARVPILADHRTDMRVGHGMISAKTRAAGGLKLSGELLSSSPHAKEIRAHSREGFPFEASVRVMPTHIEEVRAGETVDVNGVPLHGPGHVFRKSNLREVSFVVLGADHRTSATALGQDDPPSFEATIQRAEMKPKTNNGASNGASPAPAEPREIQADAPEAVADGAVALAEHRDAPAPARVPATPVDPAAQLRDERARADAILAAAAPEQQGLARELVTQGIGLEQAQGRLQEDLRTRFSELRRQMAVSADRPLGQRAPASPAPPIGGEPGAPAFGGGDDPISTMLGEASGRFDSDRKLRQQWHSREAFLLDVLSREPGSDRFSERFQDPAVLLASSKAIRLLMQDPREQAREVLLAASTTATPLTLRNVTGSYYLKLAQQLGAGWYRTAASTFTTDQPVETYPWLGQAPNLRKWEGERSVQELRSDVVTLINDDYEGTITFRGPDLRRDKTGQMIARAGELAQRVAQFPERLISNLILANGNAYDGAAFFADTRSVGASGNIDNNLTTGDNLAGGSAPTTAQQSNNLLIGLSRLMGFLDDQGEPLNEGAREFLAMVPASLYAATVAAVNAAFTSASATNPLSELVNSGMRFRVVLNARLGTGANDTWYLMRTDAGILPFIVQEELTMPISLDQGSEYYAMNNKAIFGHGWAGAAGYGRPELICKLKNS